MKKIIFFLALLLISCHSTKKTTENVAQKLQSNTEVTKQSSGSENAELKQNSVSTIDSTNIKAKQLFEVWKKNYQANVKTYDTSKPIVPGTDRPPLASETTISNNESNDKNLQENSKTDFSKSEKQQLEASYKKQYDSKLDSINNINTSLKSKVTEAEKKASYWYWWLISGAVIVILIQLAWKLTPLQKIFFFIKKRN